MLSSYLSSHIYLLEDISKQLDKIKNNWNKYIETKERKKYNEIINKDMNIWSMKQLTIIH